MAKKKDVNSENSVEVITVDSAASELENKIADAFNSAREAGQTEDQIKLAMINAGATFKGVSKIYSDLMVSAGLAMSKEDQQKIIADSVSGVDLSSEDAFNGVVNILINHITGCTESQAKSLIRAYAKKNELACFTPEKTVSNANRNPFVTNFHAALVENPNLTEDELKAIISALPDEHQVNPNRWFTQHNNIRKLVNKVAAKYAA